MSQRPLREYDGSDWDKNLGAAMAGFFGLVFLTITSEPGLLTKCVGVLLALACWAAIPRWLAYGRVAAYPDHVAVHGLLRTRRWGRSELRRFVVGDRGQAFAPLLHRTLGAEFTDGTTRWAGASNASSRERTPTWVDQAADDLNRWLAGAF